MFFCSFSPILSQKSSQKSIFGKILCHRTIKTFPKGQFFSLPSPFPFFFFFKKGEKKWEKRTSSSLLLLLKKGKKKGKRSFKKKREKNQGIKPFSPSSTSSFWGEKGERKRRKQGRKGKRKDLVRFEQGLMFLLYFFFFSERERGKRFLPLTETLGCP